MARFTSLVGFFGLLVLGCGGDDTPDDAGPGMCGDDPRYCYACGSGPILVGCDAACPPGTSPEPVPPSACYGGVDAGADASVPELPGTIIAEGLCENADGSASVAVAPDGTRVAYVLCEGTSGRVVVDDARGGAPVELGAFGVDTTLEWSPDGTFLLHGAPGAPILRRADASEPAVALSSDSVLAHRFLTIDPSSAEGDEREAVVYSSIASSGVVSIAVRELAAIDMERVLVSDATLDPSLDVVSPTGQNVFVTLGGIYRRVSTEAPGVLTTLPFGRSDLGLIQPGVGNTHGVVHTPAGGLIYRSLETDIDERVFAMSGVDPAHPVLRLAVGADPYMFFIVDGDPARHLRSFSAGTTEMLASASAWFLASTPDESRVVFPSADNLFSVPTDGSEAAIEIVPHFGSTEEIAIAFSEDSRQVAVVAAGRLRRASVDASGESTLLESAGVPSTGFFFTAVSNTLVWLRSDTGELKAALASTRTVSPEATSLWSIPSSGDVLYAARATLRRVTL